MRKGLLLFVVCTALLCAGATSVSAQEDVYKEALGKMLKLSGALSVSETMMPQLISIMKQSVPNVPESYWDSFSKKWEQKAGSKLVELYVPIYKKYLSLEDLKKIVEFYESPVGKKLATATPAMTAEGMQLGQKFGMEIVEEMKKDLEGQGYK